MKDAVKQLWFSSSLFHFDEPFLPRFLALPIFDTLDDTIWDLEPIVFSVIGRTGLIGRVESTVGRMADIRKEPYDREYALDVCLNRHLLSTSGLISIRQEDLPVLLTVSDQTLQLSTARITVRLMYRRIIQDPGFVAANSALSSVDIIDRRNTADSMKEFVGGFCFEAGDYIPVSILSDVAEYPAVVRLNTIGNDGTCHATIFHWEVGTTVQELKVLLKRRKRWIEFSHINGYLYERESHAVFGMIVAWN